MPVGSVLTYKASGMWKSILSVKDEFYNCVWFRAHNGQKFVVWNKLLCGDSILKEQFPGLYLLNRRQEAVGGKVLWEFSLQRNLSDTTASDMIVLLSMLEKVFPSLDRKDEMIWDPDSKGQCSVTSFYEVLHGGQARKVGWKRLWNPLVPSRILVFCWLVHL